MEDRKGSPAWVTDLLDFGHNLGLALALAGFGSVAYHVEAVRGPENWNQYLAIICLLVAITWGAISGSHLSSQLASHTGLKSRKWANVLIGGFCIGVGASVALLAPLIPDNNHIVSLCEKYAGDSADAIHNATECQRLYTRRADYERSLRGQ